MRDDVFRRRMIENNRDEKVCRAWDVLADEDHTYHLSEKDYFYYRNNWWLHLNKSGNDTEPLRKRSDFKQSFSTLKRLHQEAGGEHIEPVLYWKYKRHRVSPLPGGNGQFLVVCLRIQRKSRKMRQAKACDRSGQPVIYRTLAKTSAEWLSRIHLFFTDRSVTADVGLL